MTTKPKSNKLIVGLMFIAGALFLGFAGFYLFVVKPEMAARQAQPAEIAAPAAEETVAPSPPSDQINLQTLVQEAETVYGPEEKRRREGFLWIDRQESKYVVTLGALNGLSPGNYLTVYEGSKRMGQVAVDTPFDVISYVHPVDATLSLAQNEYYRVVIE
jgi:hypothetical protein